MIVRIKFEGEVTEGKKKSVLPDHIDIHVPPGEAQKAKEIFLDWTKKNAGIRGASGIFHPLLGDGRIKIKSVQEKTDG